MPTLYLTSLPAELLHDICERLKDSHFPSLCALSLASHACHAAASRSLFQKVTLHIRDGKVLEDGARQWISLLQRNVAFDVVKILTFSDRMSHRRASTYQPPNTTEVRPDEGTWRVVVGLIERITCLYDWELTCGEDPPMSIIEALHKHHPQCRFHLASFSFESKSKDPLRHPQLDLITSPSLHSIRFRYSANDVFRTGWHCSHEATMLVIGVLAPKLKNIGIRIERAKGGSRRRLNVPPLSLESSILAQSAKLRKRPTAVNEIEFSGVHLSHQSLSLWKEVVDFENVKAFTASIVSRLDAETLAWMTEHLSFERLRHLSVHLGDNWQRETSLAEAQSLGISAVNFMTSLTPLKELNISGWITKALFNAAITHHGKSLRILHLHHTRERGRREMESLALFMDADDCTNILTACPHLEDLALCITRTRGRGNELEIYRLLSRFPRLQDVSLQLDCSGHPSALEDEQRKSPNDPEDPIVGITELGMMDQRNDSRSLRVSDIVNALHNSAIDEALARQIWSVIASKLPADRNRPLTSLKLIPVGCAAFGQAGCRLSVEENFKMISRSFAMTRAVRDDQTDQVDVEELRDTFDDDLDMSPSASEIRDRAVRAKDRKSIEGIWDSIWPRKSDSPDWTKDWSSEPLKLDEPALLRIID